MFHYSLASSIVRIYLSMFIVIATEPFFVFTIPIKSDDYEEAVSGIQCCLRFEYTELYPEEPPVIDIEAEEDFECFEPEELKNHIIDQVFISSMLFIYMFQV